MTNNIRLILQEKRDLKIIDGTLEYILNQIREWEKMYLKGDCSIDTIFFDTRSLRGDWGLKLILKSINNSHIN